MFVSTKAFIATNEQPAEPKPDFALVFYTHPTMGTAVTRHPFNGDEMQAGEILDQEKVFALLNQTKARGIQTKAEQAQKAGGETITLIPQSLIFEDDNWLVWYQPARKNPMWYRLSGQNPFRLDVEWPALLFIAPKGNVGSLRILTLDNNERPTLDSQTYFTPLANIYEHHNLCQGSAPLPKERSVATLAQMEATLYDSAFDGFKHKKIFKGAVSRSDGVTFWKEKAATGKSVDVKEELYPFTTVREILENLNNQTFFSAAA